MSCGPYIDIGCGVGLALQVLGQNNAHAIGLDLSRSEILNARKRCANLSVDFVVADAQNLPFKDETLRGAVCLHLLEHVPNPKRVVDEIHRVLKTTSFLLAEVPNGFSLNEYVSAFIYKLRRKDIRNVHRHRFTEITFETLFYCSWEMKQKYRHGFFGAVLTNVMGWAFFSLSSHRRSKVGAEFFLRGTSSLTKAPLLPKVAQVIDSSLSSKFPSKAVCFTYLYEKP